MKHYPNFILRNIMVFSAMVYFKHAYRPTSPHSPNQQIHAYKKLQSEQNLRCRYKIL